MIDKSKELTASVRLVNDRLHFSATVEGNKAISIDYVPPLGDNLGYTSLELLLLSLSSCIGSAVLTFLRKMNKTIISCNINTHGIRKQDHPTGFKSISVEINIQSSDVKGNDMQRVIKMAEDTYCPVWSMLKGNVEVDIKFNVLPYRMLGC
jgi:putative redox protein